MLFLFLPPKTEELLFFFYLSFSDLNSEAALDASLLCSRAWHITANSNQVTLLLGSHPEGDRNGANQSPKSVVWGQGGLSLCSLLFIDSVRPPFFHSTFVCVRSSVWALKSGIKCSHLLYYSSLISVYFHCLQCSVALCFLYWGYLHLSLQVFFCLLSVFLWSLLHYTSVNLCPRAVVCLCCSVTMR